MSKLIIAGLAWACFFFVGTVSVLAQSASPVPEENPTGNTGALKAQVETGGSYDAHSGNGTRIVTDIWVPGALGAYELNFTRYWNSLHNNQETIYPEWPVDFGASSWSHSWHWKAEEFAYSEVLGGDGGEEIFVTTILITFPDGHTTNYKVTRSNRAHGFPPHEVPADPRLGPPYTQAEIEGAWPNGGPGVHDHICNMAPDGSQFWLCRADGGSVHFVGSQAVAVYDRHGFKTDLIYDQARRLVRVQQEGGRWLELNWAYFDGGWTVITKVRSGGGGGGGTQQVFYKYIRNGNFLVLAAVGYENQPAPGLGSYAYYSYEERAGFPVLKRAADPHFEGAMTKIAYGWHRTHSFPIAPHHS